MSENIKNHKKRAKYIYIIIFLFPMITIILSLIFAKNEIQHHFTIFDGESINLPIGKLILKENKEESTIFFLNGDIQNKLDAKVKIDKKERVDTSIISIKVRENQKIKVAGKNIASSEALFNDSILDIPPMGVINFENFDSSTTKIVMTNLSKNYKNLGEAIEISYNYPNIELNHKQWIFKNYPKYNQAITKDDSLSISWSGENYVTKYYVTFFTETVWGKWRVIFFTLLSFLSISIFITDSKKVV